MVIVRIGLSWEVERALGEFVSVRTRVLGYHIFSHSAVLSKSVFREAFGDLLLSIPDWICSKSLSSVPLNVDNALFLSHPHSNSGFVVQW